MLAFEKLDLGWVVGRWRSTRWLGSVLLDWSESIWIAAEGSGEDEFSLCACVEWDLL